MCIDAACRARIPEPAYGSNAASRDANIRRIPRRAGAVDDVPVTDDQVITRRAGLANRPCEEKHGCKGAHQVTCSTSISRNRNSKSLALTTLCSTPFFRA